MAAEAIQEACPFCGTNYEVPAGFYARIERTLDGYQEGSGPASAAAVAFDRITGQPNFEMVLHHCKRGVAVREDTDERQR